MKMDWETWRWILSFPESSPHWLYRREVAKYVDALTEEQRQDLRERRYEILEKWADWTDINHMILCKIGFGHGEAEILKDKRLTSPGMRHWIRKRGEEIRVGRKAKAKVG